MAERSESQRIGSSGHKLVALLIEKTQVWVARQQDEDFGVDMEAELAEPAVGGDILKIQIKGTEAPEIGSKGVKFVIDAKYLRLAENLRVPLVFVVADVVGDRAWYLWLQGWLVEQRRAGKSLASFGESVTTYVPEADTLTAGLKGPLKGIARWSHPNQMIVSLVDTIRTAVATRDETVLKALTELIGAVEASYGSFPLERVIDEVVEMSTRPRAAWELSMLGRFLSLLGRNLGDKIGKANILRMVVPGDGVSRAGLNGLGTLYDEHADHLRPMDLPAAFDELAHPEAAYYCRLREKHPGVSSIQLASGKYDYTVGDLTAALPDIGTLMNKWANRGESIYLDYLTRVGPTTDAPSRLDGSRDL